MYSICNVHVRKNFLTLKWWVNGGEVVGWLEIYYIVGGGEGGH
jgi:hypothetical protein